MKKEELKKNEKETVFVKKIKIPFFSYTKEYTVDAEGNKKILRREAKVMDDPIGSLITCVAFEMVANGISSLIRSCKKSK